MLKDLLIEVPTDSRYNNYVLSLYCAVFTLPDMVVLVYDSCIFCIRNSRQKTL